MTNKVNPNPDASEWTGGPSKTKGRFAQTVASGPHALSCPGPALRLYQSWGGDRAAAQTDRLWEHGGGVTVGMLGSPGNAGVPTSCLPHPQAPLSTSRENWEL